MQQKSPKAAPKEKDPSALRIGGRETAHAHKDSTKAERTYFCGGPTSHSVHL